MKAFILAAITADGYIARNSHQLSTTWTTPTDKRLFVQLTKEAGVMVMGANSFATIGKGLPGRRTIVYSHHQPAAPIPGVEFTAEEPKRLLDRLEAEGFDAVAICGGLQVNNMFLQNQLITDLHVTIQPKLFGTGVRLFDLLTNANLKLEDSQIAEDGTVALHYHVIYTT